MPIDVYESTCFEQLWSRFQTTLSEPQSSALANERIVVPGRGWENRLNQRLASAFGCWAQFRFQLFGSWVGETLEHLLDDELAPQREPDSLTWDIAALLPGLSREPQFAAIRGYLASAGDTDSRPLIDLARCIAGLFDRYLLYRPELIDAWEAGRSWPAPVVEIPAHADWQRMLWTKIRERRQFRSVHAMVGDLRTRLHDGNIDPTQLDERVSVWLNAGIAPVHLAFLEAVGWHSAVSVYVLTPADEFWGDMRGRRQLLKQLRDTPQPLSEFCRENHLELMHPLLASLGDLSRQQQMLMVDCDSEPWRFHELEESPPTAQLSLLGELQSDIRRAHEPERRELPSDSSVRIHSCHSPLREVEVLHAQIRDALESDPSLPPEEIAVFCPDVAIYAPLVRAVFGVTEAGRPGHIPFHLAGASLRRVRPVADAFFQLLDVLPGRFSVGTILDALRAEAIGASAGLRRDDVARLSEWIEAAGIRWGLDVRHREAEQLPPSPLNTWQHGLDRLLLGYAMPPGSECLVGDVLTLDRAEGLDAVLPGRLWGFLSRLKSWRDRLSDPRPIVAWRETLTAFARQMLDDTADGQGLERLIAALDKLVQLAESSDFHQPLPLPVVARELSRQVDDMSGGAGVRVGGVTFCGLDDLRSLPFRVVGLLGMNDGAFPRADRPLRFDLMTESPRPGDSTSRGEDRHLFLEALLAARERLIITFQGQNDRDQKLRPASAVVEELLDAIERSEPVDSGETTAKSGVFVRHPLQSFSPRYFAGDDERLYGFDRGALTAAEQLSAHATARPVFATPVREQIELLEEIRTHDLRRLLERPWTLYLERLGIFIEEPVEATGDHEPLLLDALEQWAVGDRWLTARLAGQSSDRLSRWLLQSGQLPAGSLGQRVLAELQRQGEEVLRNAAEAGIARVGDKLHIEMECAGVRIVGDLPGWSSQTIQRVTYSKISSKRIPGLWLDTLLATAARKRRCRQPAILVGRPGKSDSRVMIDPPTAAAARVHLEQLVNLSRAARETPLPLFPESLAVVTDALRHDANALSDMDQLLRRARREYEGNPHKPGSSQDPSVKAAFAGQDPFALKCRDVPEFASLGDTNLFAYLAGKIGPGMVEALSDKNGKQLDSATSGREAR